MQSSLTEIPTIIGTEMDGGYYAGRARIDSKPFALILPPKNQADIDDVIWIPNRKEVSDARSFNDGLANTIAMARAGSKIAQMALDLGMYIPAMDELEIAYRNLKPTTDKNWCYARSGINLNAVEPTEPYTPDFPQQTNAELFRASGTEAFEPAIYWSSTQSVSDSGGAWSQYFSDGNQGYDVTGYELRARFFRRSAI